MNTQNSGKKMFEPTTIVIFGITGDLAKRKLIPALWRLFVKGYLPDEFSIIGFARREWSDDELRVYVKDIIAGSGSDTSEGLADFLARITSVSGDFGAEESYRVLSRAIESIDERLGVCASKLFHLAVPPDLYEGIFERLHASGLSDMCAGLGGWTRVLVEKPFGSDWYTAQELDRKLGTLFKEEQIFRVDHYMGKESIQNILAFRFSNALLEHLWDARYIERVHIRLWETLGMEGRGSFYDKVGALRDVGQNHILQMLSFIAMEDPQVFEAEAIRDARAKVLGALRPIGKDDIAQSVRRGQYRGFTQEPSVAPDSKTETYFCIKAHIDNERWKGVPFYLESGKKLGESKVEIEIVFRKKESCLCPPGEELHPQNTLVFRIQPHESIGVCFWAKRPGFEMKLEPRVLSFAYNGDEAAENSPDAYERVIFDCIVGDQTLFASTQEVFGSWKFITPIIEQWDTVPMEQYEPRWIPNSNY